MRRKVIVLLSFVLVVAAIYFFIGGLEKEMSRIEITPDEDAFQPIFSGEIPDDPDKWLFDGDLNFFVEYRLERDRVRGQEMEMLNDMINNPQVGEEARNEAEKQLLNLVDLMEKELMIENMLKAQGYNDALLFTRKGVSTVMVDAEKMNEEDYLRISEAVSSVTGVPREQVQVIERN